MQGEAGGKHVKCKRTYEYKFGVKVEGSRRREVPSGRECSGLRCGGLLFHLFASQKMEVDRSSHIQLFTGNLGVGGSRGTPLPTLSSIG